MTLVGGERIVSRIETRELIRKAKKANKSKKDLDYKKLGKYMIKVLDGQKLLLQSRMPVYQLGETVSFPLDVAIK